MVPEGLGYKLYVASLLSCSRLSHRPVGSDAVNLLLTSKDGHNFVTVWAPRNPPTTDRHSWSYFLTWRCRAHILTDSHLSVVASVICLQDQAFPQVRYSSHVSEQLQRLIHLHPLVHHIDTVADAVGPR